MHNSLFPKFALYRLRLLELGARLQTLQAYFGSTVRGIFAASFRQVVLRGRKLKREGSALPALIFVLPVV
jgi:hypothetical protein